MDLPAVNAFEHYFDAVPLPLVVVTAAGVILQANPHVAEVFGYGPSELVGENIERLVPERFGVEAWKSLAYRGLLRAKPTEMQHEVSARRKDGTEFPVHINCNVVPGPRGLQYLLSFVDISARKKIEAQMAEMSADLEVRTRELDSTREDFQYLFLHNPLAMFLYDPQALRFVKVNDAALAVYGYSREELLGMSVMDIHPEDLRDKLKGAVKEAQRRELSHNRNWRHLTKDGRVIEVDTYSRALGRNENSIRLVAIVDVTERNKAEAQLRQSQKMEAIGQLTGGVAHDFNNLLTIILGNLEMIAEECGDSPHIRDMVGDALASVHRGASLTQRLLAYARQQPLEPKLVDVHDLVTDMAGLFRRSLGEQITVQQYLTPDVWRTCVDPSQLENAMLNLAVNARDAMPHGGKLTIEAQNHVLDAEYAATHAEVTPGEYVQIAISDTGSGIPKKILDQILEPFFTTKPVGKGTGLGLSMVYGFIKQSGGHLKIYSEEGVGTTVKLYLPRAGEKDEATESLQMLGGMPRAQGGEVILLVEDDPTIRKLVGKLIAVLGYGVLTAEDGPTALDVMSQAERLDLLLTDVVLPSGMSGVVLATEAQLRHPGLKVLYMSGYTRNALVNHHGHHDENAHLLSKPFRKEELARAIHRALVG